MKNFQQGLLFRTRNRRLWKCYSRCPRARNEPGGLILRIIHPLTIMVRWVISLLFWWLWLQALCNNDKEFKGTDFDYEAWDLPRVEIVATRRAEEEVICYIAFGLEFSWLFMLCSCRSSSSALSSLLLFWSSWTSCSTGRALSSSAITLTIMIIMKILLNNFEHYEDLVQQSWSWRRSCWAILITMKILLNRVSSL